MIASLPAIFRAASPKRVKLAKPAPQAALIIGDDGYRIALLRGDSSGSGLYAAAGDEGRASIHAWLKSGRIKRIRIISDQTGQAYSREDIPKAGRRDRDRILKRRLASRFGEQALATALPVGQGDGPGEDGATSCLLAALAGESEIPAWLDEFAAAQIEVTSIGLLPLEWAAFLPTILDPLSPDADGDTWRVVVTRHRTGGIRHVVLRGHQLVLTRLTRDHVDAPIAGASATSTGVSDAGVPNAGTEAASRWGGRLHAEVEASIGYIKRFGYTTNQKLIVSLIGGQSFVELVDDINRATAANWQAHRIEELAATLGLAPTADEHGYADPMIATLMSALPVRHALSSPQWLDQRRRRQQTSLTRLAVGMAASGLIAWSGWLALELGRQEALNQESLAALGDLEQERAALADRASALPANLQPLRDFLKVYEELYAFEQDLQALHGAILRSLGTDIRLDRLAWQTAIEGGGPHDAEVAMALDLGLADGVRHATELAARFLADLAGHLPEHEIEVLRQAVPLALADESSGAWNASEASEAAAPPLAGEITLRAARRL